MSRVDLYTPWREPPDVLLNRTVGRAAIMERLRHGVAQIAEGKRPLSLFLFGPRGVGKSHLIALLADEGRRRGVPVRVVPEDVPSIRSAAELLERVERDPDAPAWLRLRSPAAGAAIAGPNILVIEALDRRLSELGSTPEGRVERQKLRAYWEAHPQQWVVGTGVELGVVLTDANEPFYGWFDPEVLPLLSTPEATEIMERLVPEETRGRAHWPGRRDALVALAGGSPRVLATLAEICAAPDTPDAASDALLVAVDRFTAHYQMRFRDLSPNAQHIVELLASGPRELGPSEMARWLRTSAPSVGTEARRLAHDGVLVRREEGSSTWYRLAESLFRFWLEYRTGAWESTRVAIATSLLQALFSPDEAVDRWWSAGDANGGLVERAAMAPRQQRVVLDRVRSTVNDTIETITAAELKGTFDKARKAGVLPMLRRDTSFLLRLASRRDLVDAVADELGDAAIGAALRFSASLQHGEDTPRLAFARWLKQISSLRATRVGRSQPGWFTATGLVLSTLDLTSGPGTGWVLRDEESTIVAGIPFLRAALLLRGRLASHPAVLEPESLLQVTLQPDAPDLVPLLASALVRNTPELVERVLLVSMQDRGGPGRNPRPAVACPRRPDLLVSWLTRPASAGIGIANMLSWAASFAGVSDTPFNELLQRVSLEADSPGSPITTKDRADVRTALLSLGLSAPERLTRLVGVLRPPWKTIGLEADALSEQLRDTGAGRLHPELARLREALLQR